MIQKFSRTKRLIPFKSLLSAALLSLVAPWLNQAWAQGSVQANLPKDGWAMAEVVVESALIHQKPNDVSFITGAVPKGEILWIKNISDESEWFLVRPEEGSLSWILETDISEIRKGEGRVKNPNARVRPGRAGAKLPGPPGLELPQGATVWLLSREPLVLPQREGLITWRAIEPPTAELRYTRKENLRQVEKKTTKPAPVEGFVAAKGPGTFASANPSPAAEKPSASGMPKAIASPNTPSAKQTDQPLGELPEPAAKPAKPSIESLAILDAPGTKLDPSSPNPEDLPATPSHNPKTAMPPSASFDRALPADASNASGVTSDQPLELPADTEQALEILDSRFRLIVSQPLVAWDFQSFLKSCDQLARQPLSAPQAARLNTLREKAQAQDEIGASSRKFWDSMRRSRSYDPSGTDGESARVMSRKVRFDVTGLLLPSRRDIDGHLLYNLIGESGTTTAYLKLPPASPVEKWLGKRVGVRGRVRYNEELRARLVSVQDLELLEPDTE